MKNYFANLFLIIRSNLLQFFIVILFIFINVIYSDILFAEYSGVEIRTGSEATSSSEKLKTGTESADQKDVPVIQESVFVPGSIETIDTGTGSIILSSENKTTVEKILSMGSVSVTNSANQIKNIGNTLEEVDVLSVGAKIDLVKMVNQNIADIIKNAESSGKKIDTIELFSMQNKILSKIDLRLDKSLMISSNDLKSLKSEINSGILEIKSTFEKDGVVPKNIDVYVNEEVKGVLDALLLNIKSESVSFVNQMGDLLYEDKNKDGVSDYDSILVFNLDPEKPSPVSLYKEKKIIAAEKILLGFDPTKEEIEKINFEQPTYSRAPTVSLYKVTSVVLSEKKEIIFRGKSLPNSFITLYIYSTPIIVTVKANSSGEWQYTLKEELEDGEHIIYIATVNNSGRIIAKSSGFVFTKKAEAVTLGNQSLIDNSKIIKKPGLFSGTNFFIIIGFSAAILLVFFVLIGVISRKNASN